MSGEETFGLTVLEAMACGVPPIVPDFDGVPSVVGDAGLVADADNFDRDIGTLVSYPSPVDFSEKINLLLNDDELRETLSQKARERALSFTWDKTARRIIQFFEDLHRKRQLVNPNGLINIFLPNPTNIGFALNREGLAKQAQHRPRYKSIVLSMNERYERCLMRDTMYSQRVEDGFVMTLLKNHTVREAEALLAGLIEDEAEAKAILKRVRGLIHATA